MNTSNRYSELLQQYPEYMTKDQMYKVENLSVLIGKWSCSLH